MQSWLRTRNSLEAAALEALDIPVQSVTMLDHKTSETRTDYNLAETSDITVPGAQAFRTGQLRASFADGTMDAAHPYRATIATMHNRSRLLEAQHGKSMTFKLAADTPPQALYLLEPGPRPLFPPGTPTIKTYDQDRALAHITCGSQLMDIVKDGRDHFYVLTRLSFHNIDLEPLWNAYNANAVFPALRWHPFGLAIQALHCLRERRKIIHTNRYITISHRTHTHKGAAVPENAEGAIFGQVQSTLGVKL